jgi:cob(I)alamin adenosyltransferase
VPEKRDSLKLHLIDAADVMRLEQHIDRLQETLPELKHFILPGGTAHSAALHHARAVCRRADRRVLRLSRAQSVSPNILVYLNRLADLLFVMARYGQVKSGQPEIEWRPR